MPLLHVLKNKRKWHKRKHWQRLWLHLHQHHRSNLLQKNLWTVLIHPRPILLIIQNLIHIHRLTIINHRQSVSTIESIFFNARKHISDHINCIFQLLVRVESVSNPVLFIRNSIDTEVI